MSIRSVNRQIKTALQDNVLTKVEAERIIDKAEQGRLTTGETKAISDLYTEGVWYMPNTFPHGALPQPRPPQYELEPGAEKALHNFFVEEKVPQGQAYGTAKTEIEFALKDFDYGCALDTAPKTKHLHHVHLDDQRMVDGPRTDAYVNTAKQEFFLKVTGSGMAGPDTVGPTWYGPIAMKEVDQADVVKDKADAFSLAMALGMRTSRTHTPQVTDVAKNDDGTFTATVKAINWRDPSDILATGKAIVDGDGEFIRAASTGTDDVKDKIDAFALAQESGLSWNRTYTPHVASVTKRDDGFFDVVLTAAHFLRPDDVTDTKRAVVDADGQVQNVAPSLTDATRAKMLTALADAKANASFDPHGYPPAGGRFERVLLERQPGFDTYSFAALIPVGALAPGAKVSDPNEADQIYIERSGGFAGITMFAGPLDLD